MGLPLQRDELQFHTLAKQSLLWGDRAKVFSWICILEIISPASPIPLADYCPTREEPEGVRE